MGASESTPKGAVLAPVRITNVPVREEDEAEEEETVRQTGRLRPASVEPEFLEEDVGLAAQLKRLRNLPEPADQSPLWSRVDRIRAFPYVSSAFENVHPLGAGAYGNVSRANVRLRANQLRSVPTRWLSTLPTSFVQKRLEHLHGERGVLTENGVTVVVKKMPKSETSARRAKTEMFVLDRFHCAHGVLCGYTLLQDTRNFYLIARFEQNYVALDELLAQRRQQNLQWTTQQAYTLAFNLICGLETIHRAGVAHRDIKSANLLVNPLTLDIEYIDFGEACVESMCETRKPALSPGFAAPETIQTFLRGADKSPPWNLALLQVADVWSLGIVMLDIFLEPNVAGGILGVLPGQTANVMLNLLQLSTFYTEMSRRQSSLLPWKQLSLQSAVDQRVWRVLHNMLIFRPIRRSLPTATDEWSCPPVVGGDK
jgi:serine/threonine protein kinase